MSCLVASKVYLFSVDLAILSVVLSNKESLWDCSLLCMRSLRCENELRERQFLEGVSIGRLGFLLVDRLTSYDSTY